MLLRKSHVMHLLEEHGKLVLRLMWYGKVRAEGDPATVLKTGRFPNGTLLPASYLYPLSLWLDGELSDEHGGTPERELQGDIDA